MTDRSQALYGNNRALRKLTPDDVRLIREAVAYREAEKERLRKAKADAAAEYAKVVRELSTKVLGQKMGVSQRVIERIAYNDSWLTT